MAIVDEVPMKDRVKRDYAECGCCFRVRIFGIPIGRVLFSNHENREIGFWYYLCSSSSSGDHCPARKELRGYASASEAIQALKSCRALHN